jgi:hypothetical protein
VQTENEEWLKIMNLFIPLMRTGAVDCKPALAALFELRKIVKTYGEQCVHAFVEQLKCFDPKEGSP